MSIDWVKTSAYAFALYLGITLDIFVAWLGLMILDALFGIASYTILNEFSWKKFRVGIFAKFLIVILPIAFSLLVKTAGKYSTSIGFGVDFIIFLFALGDTVSIFYHFLSIKQQERVKPKNDVILLTINFVLNKMKSLFETLTK